MKIMELIQREWNTYHFGSPSYIWESKLRAVKVALKKWAKEDFVDPIKQKISLQRQLAALQSRMEVEEVSIKHLKQEKELNLRILKASRYIEEGWRIKSRQKWLNGRHNNIVYFHKQSKV